MTAMILKGATTLGAVFQVEWNTGLSRQAPVESHLDTSGHCRRAKGQPSKYSVVKPGREIIDASLR